MKNTKTLLFLGTIMLFCSIKTFAQKDSIALQREARKMVREGNKLYDEAKYTDASVAYKKALEKNGLYKKASYNLGNSLYQGDNFKEAIPQYELIAKNAKNKIDKAQAYHNIGNAMMKQKQYQQAVDAYKNALRNNPNDDETRYNLAVAQKLLDKKKNQDKKKNNKNKNKDNKDKKKQDDNKDQNKDKKDGDDKDKKDPDKKNDGGDKKNKDPKKDKDNKKKPQPNKSKMSPEQIKQLLESLNNEEKKTQKKLNARKAKGKKVKQEKDW